jgi:hypothetical protein
MDEKEEALYASIAMISAQLDRQQVLIVNCVAQNRLLARFVTEKLDCKEELREFLLSELPNLLKETTRRMANEVALKQALVEAEFDIIKWLNE